MFEVMEVYFSWWPLYPIATLEHFVDAPIFLSVWFVITSLGLVALTRVRAFVVRKVWVAATLMPTTIICGSWELVPWPLGVFAAFGRGGCSTVLSLAICLSLNLVLVFVVAYALSHLRARRPAV